MRGYDDDRPTPGYSEYTGPARAPSVNADAWTPIVQSCFVGVVVGGLCAGVIASFGGTWLSGGAGCAGCAALAWFVWRTKVCDSTLYETSRRDTRPVQVQQIDMGSPGHVIMNANAGRAQLARQNADRGREEFLAFVRGCEHGATTVRAWEPRIGRPKYTAWRDELLQAGWAEREGDAPNSPWHLTATAEEIAQATEAGE